MKSLLIIIITTLSICCTYAGSIKRFSCYTGCGFIQLGSIDVLGTIDMRYKTIDIEYIRPQYHHYFNDSDASVDIHDVSLSAPKVRNFTSNKFLEYSINRHFSLMLNNMSTLKRDVARDGEFWAIVTTKDLSKKTELTCSFK